MECATFQVEVDHMENLYLEILRVGTIILDNLS